MKGGPTDPPNLDVTLVFDGDLACFNEGGAY